MIRGIGIDVIEVARVGQAIESHGTRFLERVFTDQERRAAASKHGAGVTMHLAGRFAAKEAALKALGTGLAAGMAWQDVEVVAGENGAPMLVLRGTAQARMLALGARTTHVSVTHTREHAAAVVILEA